MSASKIRNALKRFWLLLDEASGLVSEVIAEPSVDYAAKILSDAAQMLETRPFTIDGVYDVLSQFSPHLAKKLDDFEDPLNNRADDLSEKWNYVFERTDDLALDYPDSQSDLDRVFGLMNSLVAELQGFIDHLEELHENLTLLPRTIKDVFRETGKKMVMLIENVSVASEDLDPDAKGPIPSSLFYGDAIQEFRSYMRTFFERLVPWYENIERTSDLREVLGSGVLREIDNFVSKMRKSREILGGSEITFAGLDQFFMIWGQGGIGKALIPGVLPAMKFSELTAYRNPERRLNYRGFKIIAKGLTESELMTSLGFLDQFISLFKRRGLEAMLEQLVNQFHIVDDSETIDSNTLAFYRTMDRHIVMFYDRLKKAKNVRLGDVPAFLETLVHEIGHFFHLGYMSEDARRYWNSAWGDVGYPITWNDRAKMLHHLKKSRGSLAETQKALPPMLQKGLLYLGTHVRDYRGSLITVDKNGRMKWRRNNGARSVRKYFQSPHFQTPAGGDPELKESEDFARFSFLRMDNLSSVELHRVKGGDQEYKDLMERLQLPTGYAKTNPYEDFAETFTWFVLQPEKLSPQAIFRMKRTISLANMYGTPIMRLARKVASRFVHATLSHTEKEDREVKRLSRTSPRKKPPRKDRRRSRTKSEKDPDLDTRDRDLSLKYNKA